ncbi:MAG TPA: phosphoribosylamine--glycine ligase [Polaromonas sp.]|uniref:phosphoribosylamine--glycine ligase n=1 Tax=Polaromonas sp. TaxID=1869339 RepID=UPI002D45B3D4|nr:phosphoribosylamine--glycine ligase [Polaromonas sp.]HYW57144.1 phosphoribosylamine--glycine ligase [Polaromonas sp.]
MRFLGIGEFNDLAALYHGLAKRGHEVRVFIGDEACQDVFGGMLQTTPDWRAELEWIHQAGDQGIILFESASMGKEQDELRRQGFQVIGGSAYGDRLEADRTFGQEVCRSIGLRTAASHSFTRYADAMDFLKKRGGRYVLKFNGANSPRTRNYIGEMEDSADMLALLTMYSHAAPADVDEPDFVLMEYLQGVEVGVGAYFNGDDFLDAVCIDFEHKRFFAGELGELTGEMGTIVSYRGARKLFAATLAPLAPLLRASAYCGYININLIVNEAGVWPLEFTSRFGYPGFAICEALHAEPWESIFSKMVGKTSLHLKTQEGFACGVVLTVPPFPYRLGYAELSKGEPICFRPGMTPADHARLHFAEVAEQHGQLVTSGATGYIGVATGTGKNVEDASREAYRVARMVVIPNLRYRTDIGERVRTRDWQQLETWGWIDSRDAQP